MTGRPNSHFVLGMEGRIISTDARWNYQGEPLSLDHFHNIHSVPKDWIEKQWEKKIGKVRKETSKEDSNSDNSGSCWDFGSGRDQATYERNYVQVKLRYTHIALAINGQYPTHPLDECSHRCHNKKCINPSHLVWEPKWRNNKRKLCEKRKLCICGSADSCIFPK
jgi:hypothetical protein